MMSSYYVLKMLKKYRSERLQKAQKEDNIKICKANFSTSLKEYENRCRLCLGKGKFSIYEDTTTVEAIKTIVDINIEESDDLPKLLCKSCNQLIRGVLELRTTAQDSENFLKRLKTKSLDYDQDTNIVSPIQSDHLEAYSEPNSDVDEDNLPLKTEKPTTKQSLQHKKSEKISCRICHKEVTKYYYKDHLALHGYGTPKPKVKTECKICKKVLERAYLKQHMSIVHSKQSPKHVCDVCGKTFRFLSGYKSHIVSHFDDFPFKCDLCPYKGRHKGLLQTHMRVHTRDYKYQCSECPARFLTSGNLSKHMLKHKEKKFKCDTCSRSFHSKPEMEKHFQVDHLGIKNHICNICDKAFGYRGAMMKHQLHVHKRQKSLSVGRVPSYIEVERKKQDTTDTSIPDNV